MLVSFTVGTAMLNVSRNFLSQRITTRIQLAVEPATMARVLMLPATFFKTYNSGELASRISALSTLCDKLVNAVTGTLLSAVLSLVYLFQINALASELVAPAMLMVFALLVFNMLTAYWELKHERAAMAVSARLNGLVFALFSGIQKIKLTGSEKRGFAKWAEVYRQQAKLNYNPPKLIRYASVINGLINLTGTLAFYYVAVTRQISVSNYMLPENVGYIQLFDFAGDCYERFQEQLTALVSNGAKALIIDLRDNPGGWVDDAIHLADIFMPEETITYLQYRSGEREYYTATDGALTLPMVVLMNENSASASEILAGAFQDYGLATIVGTQSFGKGIVQFVIPVGAEGAAMQLTAAYYFTPNGRSVHKVGITPDVEASLPKDDHTLYELGDLADPQLKKAYDVTLEKLSGTFVAPAATTAPTVEPAGQVGADAQPETQDESQAKEKFLPIVS